MKYTVLSAIIFTIITSTAGNTAIGQSVTQGEWQRRSHHEGAVDTVTLSVMRDSIEAGAFGEVHSVILIKDSYMVYEAYFNGWHRDSLHTLQSVTKSIAATGLGAAIQQGFISTVDEAVLPAFADQFEISSSDGYKSRLSLSHLLTMQAGFQWKEGRWDDPENNWRQIVEYRGNWYKKILETPVTVEPGSTFAYQSGNPVLVNGYIQARSGIPLDRFYETYLFKPLEISDYRFLDLNGGMSNNGGVLLYLRPVDLAKIGFLYLNDGKWKGRRLIPGDFIREATVSQVKRAEQNPFYTYGYGYFWWTNPEPRREFNNLDSVEGVYLARGAGGQNLIVWPSENVVCVITAWNLQRPNITQTIFDRFVIPAVKQAVTSN